jgi:putative endonuclease
VAEHGQRNNDAGRKSLGRLGERLAANELERRGYRLLECNFRCQAGEVDLVAREGEELVFVEVKTRRGTLAGLPEEAITERKAHKLQQVAWSYLDIHQMLDCAWRIDVVAIQFNPAGKLEEIRVYQHAIAES